MPMKSDYLCFRQMHIINEIAFTPITPLTSIISEDKTSKTKPPGVGREKTVYDLAQLTL